MKLNLHLIARELGHIVSGSSIRSSCMVSKLDSPYLLEPNEPHLYSDNLYVAPVDIFKRAADRVKRYLRSSPNLTLSCVCIGEPLPFMLEAPNCDVIWVNDAASPTATFNAVQKIYRRYDTWEKQLMGLAVSGASVVALVAQSAPLLKNDICVTDHLSRVLAYEVYRTNAIPRDLTNTIATGDYLPKNMVIDGIMDEIEGIGFTGSHDSSEPSMSFARMRAFNCTVLQALVTVRVDYAVIVSVHSNYRDVSAADCAALAVLAEAVRRSCLNYGPAITNDRYTNTHSTLKALMEGRPVSDALLLQCSAILQWDQDSDEFAVYCITLEQTLIGHETALMRPFTSICNHLQLQLDCPALTVNDTMVVVVNLTRSHYTESEVRKGLAAICTELHLIAGASGVYKGIRSLPGCYQRAHEALRALSIKRDKNPVLGFDDRAVTIALSFIADRISPEEFCPRELLNLANEQPELYETLEAYLRLNCNANEASRALNVRRSTFVYRLDKARELVQIDLADPDERLILLMSCRLIDMFGIERLTMH